MIGIIKAGAHSMGFDQPGEACQRVLVAEDDAMFRKILHNWLHSWGYQVTIAEDDAKAWEILQGDSAPQLLILDWMMPEPNGVELCRLIRERNSSPYQYIVLLTAKDDKQDLIRGLAAGADDYLTKPFDKNELNARLRTGRRILTLQDEQIKNREKLQFQATHDSLTGIWNRRAILEARVADCTASAARAAFLLRRASRCFRKARTGIAMSAATVIPIPAKLVSGRNRRPNAPTAIAATPNASTNRRTPAKRLALRSEIGMLGTHCKSTTVAESSSTRLSEPKANIAGL
jgi:DNA-binding response OmpR family regulator